MKQGPGIDGMSRAIFIGVIIALRRVAGILIVLIGMLVIFYPRLNEAYYAYQQKKLMESLVRSWEELDEHVSGEHVELAGYELDDMESILKIDKIDLEMPVLKGATRENLDITAASIDGTGKPGQEGNCCIAAHRSRFHGQQFNRLNELAVGDPVEVVVEDETYSYRVFEKFLAKADDIWVMLPQENQKLLTLITCDYSRQDRPRLVIRAEMVGTKNAAK